MNCCIGIDLGGTNIAGGVVTLDGKLLATQSRKTGAPCDPEILADRIASLCRELAQSAQMPMEQISWIGLGVPGSVDKRAGVLEYANNLDLRSVPLAAMLRQRLERPVFLDNDANAAAWGEYCTGELCDSFVMVTLGTGVGGGIVENGRLLMGCNGAAGELGHFVMDLNGKSCNCGLRGCFEQYGSVTALIEQTVEKMNANAGSLLWKIAGDVQHVTGRTAFEALRAGDAAAREVVEQYIQYLCVGITSIVNVFQPDVLCVGGGISREGETLLAPIRNYVKTYGYARDSARQTRICQARLGPEAGIIGAALLGRES